MRKIPVFRDNIPHNFVSLQEPASLREAKIFVGILHVGNRLKAMEVAKGAYAVSDDLKVFILSSTRPFLCH